MTELQNMGPNYIGADELVFNNDKELGIYSGGFSVKSIMMKAGMSPIMTLNYSNTDSGHLRHSGGTSESEKVSDLFNDLVVPNWALSYSDRMVGGKYNENDHHKTRHNDDDDTDEDDDVVTDDLHDKLLELVKEHNAKVKNGNSDQSNLIGREKKKKVTRKNTSLKGKRLTRKTKK